MESILNRSSASRDELASSTGLNVTTAREILLEASSQCVTDGGAGLDERILASAELLRALKFLSGSCQGHRAVVGS